MKQNTRITTIEVLTYVFFVFIYAALIIFAMLNKTPISHYLNTHGTKVFTWLGTLSLYLYLIHWSVMTGLMYFGSGLNNVSLICVYYALF